MKNVLKNKESIAILCFLTDLAMAAWTYYQVKNYDAYLKIIKPMIASPDFQVQIYAVLLQSLVFSLLLFLFFHFVIYALYIRQVKYAIKYVRFYTLMAALSSVIMIFSGYIVGIIPFLVYALSYISAGKLNKK